MADGADPRVFFAAERTLLAWVRTGLAVVGLGFVVARFGLFLSMIRNNSGESSLGSTIIGVGLILLGSGAIAMSAWQQVRFCRGLKPNDRPHPYVLSWSIWFASLLSAIGMALAVYLLLRAHTSTGDAAPSHVSGPLAATTQAAQNETIFLIRG